MDPPPLPDAPELDPTTEELWSSRALLLVLLLLILSFWVSYYLKVRRIKSIHETIVALFAGMIIGLCVRISPGQVVQNMLSFKNTIMLNVLLPPIILSSGFELRQENFFRNFAVILVFAFAGTFISAVAIGVLVYVWALLGLEGLNLTIVECLIFGSTLSATDPVTILAIFNALKVDPKLYSIIFGESILNDAVAIVMFETLSQFHGEKIHVWSFFHGVGIFLLIFLVSMALGVIFGLACSLMLKHSSLAQFPQIESCLVFLIAYTSYFFSNGLTMSGIVSLLFCGITLKHYAYHNMSKRSQRTVRYMFTTLAQLSENFIFIYLGLSLFTQSELDYKPLLIIITALAVVAARYCAVFPISKLINLFFRTRGKRSEELPHSYQMMLFWAGLRGAVGVALAAGIHGKSSAALRTTVLVTVVLSVIIFGGTSNRMIEILGIKTGVEEDDGDSTDEEGPAVQFQQASPRRGSLPANTKFNHAPYLDDPHSPIDSPYIDQKPGKTHARHHTTGTTSSPYLHANYNNSRRFHSRTSSPAGSDDSDSEVLPPASSFYDQDNSDPSQEQTEGGPGAVWRNGQWFNVLDEQYLLPVFSNATASRKATARKALRTSARLSTTNLQHYNEPDAGDIASGNSPGTEHTIWLGGMDRDRSASTPNTPQLTAEQQRRFSSMAAFGGNSSNRDVTFTDAISSLLFPSQPMPSPNALSPLSPLSQNSSTSSQIPKRKTSGELPPPSLRDGSTTTGVQTPDLSSALSRSFTDHRRDPGEAR